MTAALYIDPARGPYPALLGPDACWGVERDAKGYTGPGPVIAHPPCGPWGRLAHMCTKQDPDCGPRAVEQVLAHGGALEHPAGSSLWRHCDLPRPLAAEGQLPLAAPGVWTLEVDQCRWGHPAQKRTWILLSGIRPDELPPVPAWQKPTHYIDTNSSRKGSAGPQGHLPKSKRHITPPAFARWLIAAVEAAGKADR